MRRNYNLRGRKGERYPVVLKLDDPDKVFFTADTHFGDCKALKLSNRPYESVAEMDEDMIRLWNSTVPKDGIVFHLGDFGFGSYRRGMEILFSLNGRKHLVLGNHDLQTICRGHVGQFSSVSQQMILNVSGQRVLLNHCPLLCYPSDVSMWQLFGHVHSGHLSSGYDLPRLNHLLPTQYDVGVDNNSFRPVSFFEVQARITNRKILLRKRNLDCLGIL